jgi:hypothetical protein
MYWQELFMYTSIYADSKMQNFFINITACNLYFEECTQRDVLAFWADFP